MLVLFSLRVSIETSDFSPKVLADTTGQKNKHRYFRLSAWFVQIYIGQGSTRNSALLVRFRDSLFFSPWIVASPKIFRVSPRRISGYMLNSMKKRGEKQGKEDDTGRNKNSRNTKKKKDLKTVFRERINETRKKKYGGNVTGVKQTNKPTHTCSHTNKYSRSTMTY